MRFKRLPNNFGTIDKLTGQRRKPYRARKKVGERFDEEKQKSYPIYATVGYYATRDEAMKALAIADGNRAFMEKYTFKEVYDKWQEEFIKKKPFPPGYEGVMARHLVPIHNRKIADMRTLDLESCVNNPSVPRSAKAVCSIIIRGCYDYAIRHEYVDKNYALLCKFDLDKKPRIVRKIFTADEVKMLWSNEGIVYADCLLILLYTGMRKSELREITLDDVNLSEHYIIGGMKTEAGRDRIIPIHDRIYHIIERYYKAAKVRGKEYLILWNTGKRIGIGYAEHCVMDMNLNHKPHDTRHSFASIGHECHMDKLAIERIIGHKPQGVTDDIYTHLSPGYLLEEINKLSYGD